MENGKVGRQDRDKRPGRQGFTTKDAVVVSPANPPQAQYSPGTWPVVCSSSGHGGCHGGRGVGCGNCP